MTITTEQDRNHPPAPEAPAPESLAPAAADAGSGPRRPRLRRALRVARTVTVLAALLVAAGAGGTYLVQQRLAERAFVDVGDAVLTAEAMPVGSADAGVVRQVLVAPQDSVVSGQELARITLPATGTDRQPRTQVLRAPSAGIVSAVEVAVGGVARPGEPVLTLYDPALLAFAAEVPVEQLRAFRLGMTARITGPGLGDGVTATVDQVVPRVGGDPAGDADRLTVVLVPGPAAMRTVRTLVPGLRFAATVDTTTAVGGTPAVNSA